MIFSTNLSIKLATIGLVVLHVNQYTTLRCSVLSVQISVQIYFVFILPNLRLSCVGKTISQRCRFDYPFEHVGVPLSRIFPISRCFAVSCLYCHWV